MTFDQAAYRRQKGALTRALNTRDPVRIRQAVAKAVNEWGSSAWPDDWSRWQRALDDTYPHFNGPRLEDLT